MTILKEPNAILAAKAKPIDKVDLEVIKLVKEMFETLAGQDAVGLAAPQIGESLRLAVIGFEPTKEQLKKNPDLEAVPKTVLINPKLNFLSKETNVEKEGCLSVSRGTVIVPRHTKIHVEFLDEKGKKIKLKARGYLARVIQHEIDHLEGKLITDYK